MMPPIPLEHRTAAMSTSPPPYSEKEKDQEGNPLLPLSHAPHETTLALEQDEEVQDYFARVAQRSTRRHRLITLATLSLAAGFYYLLFGGSLAFLLPPDELKPGSLQSDAYPVDHWGAWLADSAGKAWDALPSFPVNVNNKHHGCAGKKAMTPAERTEWRSKNGYLHYVSLQAGLSPSHHPHHDAADDASRGGQDFNNQLDTSVATSPTSLASLFGSNLSQVWQSLFLSVPSTTGVRASSQRYTNHTHVAGTRGDRKTALYTAQRWGELLGAKMPRHVKDLVFDAGSKESRRALLGGDEGHHHHRGHRHFSSLFSSLFKKGKKHHHHAPKPKTEPRVFIDTYYVWLNTPLNQSLTLSAKPTEEMPHPAPSFTASCESCFHFYSHSCSDQSISSLFAHSDGRRDWRRRKRARRSGARLPRLLEIRPHHARTNCLRQPRTQGRLHRPGKRRHLA